MRIRRDALIGDHAHTTEFKVVKVSQFLTPVDASFASAPSTPADAGAASTLTFWPCFMPLEVMAMRTRQATDGLVEEALVRASWKRSGER